MKTFQKWLIEHDLYQSVFPFLREEPPPDKRAKLYQNKQDYVQSAIAGAKQTETVAEKFVSARFNSWIVGEETLLELVNGAATVPAQSNRPEFSIAFAHVKSNEKLPNNKSRFRILAFWEGEKTLKNINNLDPIGGIVYIGGYITDVWVNPAWRGKDASGFSLYKELRKFAARRGVVGLDPADDLTSKSYRMSQAKYDYRRTYENI
jgi:hypothetical protein